MKQITTILLFVLIGTVFCSRVTPECLMCIDSIVSINEMIEQYKLEDPKMIKQVEEIIDEYSKVITNYCSYLKTEYEKVCHESIIEAKTYLVKMIKTGLPTDICLELELCSPDMRFGFQHEL